MDPLFIALTFFVVGLVFWMISLAAWDKPESLSTFYYAALFESAGFITLAYWNYTI